MPPALLCLSHLRWDFVYQRPNHLMARAARDRRVYFVEEPVGTDGDPGLDRHEVDGVTVVRPMLPGHLSPAERDVAVAHLLQRFTAREDISEPWLWYYTPMALGWTRGLDSSAVIYDCMDELSAFRGAPPELVQLEQVLFNRADVVFTGGRSLYEAKARQHPRVHAMPSAVDVPHFARARQPGADPDDQATIPGPRIGYYGVIDERLDLDLIAGVARLRPNWQLVLLGPVAKLAPDEVPTAPNIHPLGLKRYDELPGYLRGWDVAIMPFALNDATRYISPTKTPEYLAGGKPVVSTAIRDVVHPYGEQGLVRIAGTASEFVAAIEAALADDLADLCARADPMLAEMSWDQTWSRMNRIVNLAVAERTAAAAAAAAVPAPALGAPALAGSGGGRGATATRRGAASTVGSGAARTAAARTARAR